MTTMLAFVSAYNPQLTYNADFQLSVAADFGIMPRRPLGSSINTTLLGPFEKPPELLSNLMAVPLAAQIATTPIIAASFDEVSLIGPFCFGCILFAVAEADYPEEHWP